MRWQGLFFFAQTLNIFLHIDVCVYIKKWHIYVQIAYTFPVEEIHST